MDKLFVKDRNTLVEGTPFGAQVFDQWGQERRAIFIVAGSAGIATGAALTARKRGSDQVSVCFFGEGALGQGVLYEVMNMASLWKLPVIYVCENNLYGEYTPCGETIAGEILARPRALGVHAESVDGQDGLGLHDWNWKKGWC